MRLPSRASLAAAHDTTPQPFRELVIVEAHADRADNSSSSSGWGECSALNSAGYTSEWAEGSYQILTAGTKISPDDHPMAAAAIEMAVLDWGLRAANQTLSERLGTAGQTAPAGAVVGLNTIPAMLAEVGELVDASFGRIKCKVVPGRLTEPVRAIRADFPQIEMVLDANGSLTIDDLAALKSLRDLGIIGVEQPFAIGDSASAQRLVAETDLQVIADEAVVSPADVWALAADQAATAIAIKPPRVGGLRQALRLLEQVELAGMGATIGGMLECGLGRHVLAAMAPLSGFTITGDLSPAGRWLAEDPFSDLHVVDGHIAAPATVGIGGDPDRELLERFTVEEQVVDLAAVHPTQRM